MHRFTDTEKWQPWFRKLPLEYKVLWIFLCDACDPAGVWEVDKESVLFFIGQELDLNLGLSMINDGKERIQVIGKKWFLKDFIPFQYGKLLPENRVYKPVYRALERHGINPKSYEKKEIRDYPEALQSLQDKTRQDSLLVLEEKKEHEKKEKQLHPLAELWNDVCPKLPPVQAMSSSRVAKCRQRIHDRSLESWRSVFRKINASSFCNGENDRGWRATFDWIIANDENSLRVLEGKYDRRSSSKSLLDEISSK